MNLHHLPGAPAGDPRCNCVTCEKVRDPKSPIQREPFCIGRVEAGRYAGRCTLCRASWSQNVETNWELCGKALDAQEGAQEPDPDAHP